MQGLGPQQRMHPRRSRVSGGNQRSTPPHVKTDLGDLLQRFTRASDQVPALKIADVQAIASYSWLDAPTPTIAVPGSPGIWMNADPLRVPHESGFAFIDQNAYRMRRTGSSLAPMFAAIDDLRDFNYGGIDLVSDRNSLRKLLRWSAGAPDSKDYRIDIELAGKTCLFTRREEKDAETVVGYKGFGLEYEKATTKYPQGCEKATSYHRIISWNLGGVNVLFRFEVDACTGVMDDDELSSALSNLSITSNTEETSEIGLARPAIQGLTVIRTRPRSLVPQSSLVEVKTRSSKRPLDWAETYLLQYISQTEYLYLAKHTHGTFSPVVKYNLTGSTMLVHAQQAEESLGKLKVLLEDILTAVRAAGTGGGMCLICVGGELTLHRRKEGTGKAVGTDILSKFI